MEWVFFQTMTMSPNAPACGTCASAFKTQATTLGAARGLLLRMLVAWFVVMQVMMYAAPEYWYPAHEIEPQAMQLMRWAQWVLTWPVLVYCAQPFYERAWLALKQRQWVMDQPLVVGIGLAFLTSSAQINHFNNPVWFDCIGMIVALLLTAQWFLQKQTQTALQYLATLQPDLPSQVEVVETGQTHTKLVDLLGVGDVMRIPKGVRCPVDAQVHAHCQTQGIWVDESMRTGEQDPIFKSPGQWVYAGSLMLSEHGMLQVFSSVTEGTLAKLEQQVQTALKAQPQHTALVDSITPWFVMGVMLVAGITASLWWWHTQQVAQTVSVVLAVLLVSCPCAVALAIPLARLFAARAMAQAGVLVRTPKAMDVLGHVDWIALDKTGTLTHVPTHLAIEQTTMHYARHLSELNLEPAAMVNQLVFALTQYSQHPIAKALMGHVLGKHGVPTPSANIMVHKIVEYPGLGIAATLRFANDVLNQTYTVRLGRLPFTALNNSSFKTIHIQEASVYLSVFATLPNTQTAIDHTVLAQGLMPLLAVAWRIPTQTMADAENILQHWVSRMQVHIVSGDTQAQVDALMPNLHGMVRHATLTPAQKADCIAKAQQVGHVVMMVGDGLNDVVSFAQADVSVAALGAASVSAHSADLLLLKRGLKPVQASLDLAQQLQRIIRQNLTWALLYNSIGVPLAALGLVSPLLASIGMGLSSLVVLINSMRIWHRAQA